MNLLKRLDAILAAVHPDFIPAESSYRDASQGWNNYEKKYLASLGYSAEVIDQFYFILGRHVHGYNWDSEMADFVKANPGFVEAVAEYELDAMVERGKDGLRELERDLERAKRELEEEVPDWLASREEDKEYIREARQYKVQQAERALAEAQASLENPTVYRKGGLDRVILSWTDNPAGALFSGKNSDGEYGYNLIPDRDAKVRDLVKNKIYPVAGYGSCVNFYAEREITFVNLNMVK